MLSLSIASAGVAPGPSEIHQRLALTVDASSLLCIEGSLHQWDAAAALSDTLRQLPAITIGLCVTQSIASGCRVPIGLKACDLRVLVATEPRRDNAWNRVFATVDEAKAWMARLERLVAGRGPAAVICARTLRLTSEASQPDGLVVESLAYSLLQAGPDYQRWLSEQRRS